MSGDAPRSEAVSPTAHYTAWVWARNGLSHPALATLTGRVLFNSMQPAMAASRALGGRTLEGYLLARHRLIDDLLRSAIEEGRISQVIEIACGLSARGWRFARRYGDRIAYLETDLPAMAATKRRALERAGSLGPHHQIAELDALAADGPLSLAEVAARLDPERGAAVITEGLLGYLDRQSLDRLWARIAAALRGFASGIYLSDLHLGSETAGLARDAFVWVLSTFVRGRVELHFDDAAAAEAALRAAGFREAVLHSPAEIADRLEVRTEDARSVRVLEATP